MKTRKLSKSELYAKRIMNDINQPNLDMGGTFSLITGSPGSGKTAAMLSFINYTLKNHPKHKVFFSNGYGVPLQFVKLKNKYDILVKENCNITFHDRSNHRKQIFPQVTEFKTFKECYELAKPGRCNAVFFGDRFLQMDWLEYLLSIGEWKHVFVDEISEIAPAFTAGETFHKIGRFAISLKECRKTLTGYHCNTQSIRSLDHRIISVVMVRLYLPGAVTSKYSRITQKAIDNLSIDRKKGNECYIEAYGNFGKTRFKNIYTPDSRMLWECCVNG